MVVKAATKKKLMDLGCPQYMAHRWADDRIWYEDIIPMNFDDIMGIFPYNWLGFSESSSLPSYHWRNRLAAMDKIEYSKYIYDIVETMRENELVMVAQIEKKYRDGEGRGDVYEKQVRRSRAKYRKMIENFGIIPNGSPYSYLREDSPNFINWINVNPFEVKQ